MRRPIAAVMGTVAGLAALLSYKSGTPPRTTAVAATASGAARLALPRLLLPPPHPTAVLDEQDGRRVARDHAIRRRAGGGRRQREPAGRRHRLVVPNDRPRSAQISSIAAPILRREALAAQSASIDTVSGATYTSEAYAQSLQAALDSARQS